MSVFLPSRVLVAAFMSSVLMSSAGTSQTQIGRPVVALDCRAAEITLPGACRALKDAMRDRAPGAVQRVMDDLSDAPARPGDIALALRVDEGRARLDWRLGAEPLRPGPDATLASGTDPAPLVRRLVQALPDPLR